MHINIKKRKLKVSEYQAIRQTTSWEMLDDNMVEKALENDLFSVCVFDGNKPIGIGRVIGDGFIYFYVQDIIVIPHYKGKGIGKMIMDTIEEYLNEATRNNSFIGLMAASDVIGFYEKYGYQVRPENKPGMYKMIKK